VDIETADAESPSLGAKPAVAPPSLLQTSAPVVPIAQGIIPSKPFLLADIGEGIAEVELMAWYVKVGDRVKAFDKICEVQSDKATVEITSRYDGIITAVHHAEGGIVKVRNQQIKIVIRCDMFYAAYLHLIIDSLFVFCFVCDVIVVVCISGDTLRTQVGDALVDIQQAGAGVSEQATSEGVMPIAPVATAATNLSSEDVMSLSGGKVLTTPAVRKLAKENTIDLSRVKGTGPKGRILKEDILYVIKHGASALQPATVKKVAPASGPPVATHVPTPAAASTPPPPPAAVVPAAPSFPTKTYAAAGDTKVPIRGIQRMMVKSMSEALKVCDTAPC
jgi:2-oxoisovalerate dehydrogenase E2 component (dihydrolipoyl transacylase)